MHSDYCIICSLASLAGKILTMTANGWFQIGVFFFVILAITKPMGVFMTRVFARRENAS